MARHGLERLRYFVTFVEELEKRHDLKAMGHKLTISASPIGVHAEVTGPDEHRLRSFLIDARRLFTKGEDTDLAVILPEALRRITDPAARKAVSDAADHFGQLHAHGEPRVVLDGEDLRPSEMASLVVQGTIFHGDKRKRLRLVQIGKGDPILAALIEDQARQFTSQVVTIAIWAASVIKHEDSAGRLR